MIFKQAEIPGVLIVEPEPVEHERGLFARVYDDAEYGAAGVIERFRQWSVSLNRRRGTLRGLHFQAPPHEEAKLVRCTAGAVFDVVVDLRQKSPTYGEWASIELTAENRLTLYIPAGVAHGFQTLTDDAELTYAISEPYAPALARGVRWDDESLAIPWPIASPALSPRDRSLPRLSELATAR